MSVTIEAEKNAEKWPFSVLNLDILNFNIVTDLGLINMRCLLYSSKDALYIQLHAWAETTIICVIISALYVSIIKML